MMKMTDDEHDRRRARVIANLINMTCTAVTDMNQTLIVLGVSVDERRTMLIAVREHTNKLVMGL